MPPDALKHIQDIKVAASLIDQFVAGKTESQFLNESMLQSAVERQFEIIGEAMGRLKRLDATLLAEFSEANRIIAFRNQLIHGYDVINKSIVWRIIQQKLPVLIAEADKLLAT